MSRLMSVAFTEDQVRARTKTVTRRKGWWTDKHGRRLIVSGDTVTLCRKIQGRKPGEPIVRICDVRIVSVRREPLRDIFLPGELTAEGFPEWDTPDDDTGGLEFVERYFTPQGIDPLDDVTRIQWRYLDQGSGRA